MIKFEFIGIFLIVVSIIYTAYKKRYTAFFPLIIVLFSALYLLGNLR